MEKSDSIITYSKPKENPNGTELNLSNPSDRCNSKGTICSLEDIYSNLINYTNEYNTKIKKYHNEAFDKINKRIENYRNETQQIIGSDLNKQSHKEKTFYLFFKEKQNFICYYKFEGEKTNDKDFFCNGCGKKCNGIVYKCMTCKKNFALCKNSITNLGPLHDEKHIFKVMLAAPRIKLPKMNTDRNLDSEFQNVSQSYFEVTYQIANGPISVQVTIINNGSKSWDSNTNIDFIDRSGVLVAVGAINSGNTVTKSVTVYTRDELLSLEAGNYEKILQLTDKNGFFGKSLPITLKIKKI